MGNSIAAAELRQTAARRAYPKRPPFWSHRVIRAMFKAGTAQIFGANGIAMLSLIASTEDAKRYSSPVTFFNDQLTQLLGIRKWETLNAVRDRLVRAGWLHYEPPPSGSRRQPGIYWVMIPDDVTGLSDTAVDEGDPCEAAYARGYADAKANRPPSPYPGSGDGGRDGVGGGDGGGRGEPSILLPFPNPNPKKSKGERSIGARTEEDQSAGRHQSPSNNSCEETTDERPPPFDSSHVDWEAVLARAEKVARRIPPHSDDDRRMWIRFAVLAETAFCENWLFDAVEAVLQAGKSTKSRQAHFVAVLKSKALDEDESDLVGMMRRIEIPREVWKSELVKVQP